MQIISLSGKVSGIPLPTTETIKLTREMQEILFSYPVSSELREAVLLSDKDSHLDNSNLLFGTDRVKIRSSRSYDEKEQDRQVALALADAAIARFQYEKGKKVFSGADFSKNGKQNLNFHQ